MDVTLSMFGPTAHNESPKQTAANLNQAGATAMIIYTSLYHGYRLLQPRYPDKAIYTLETDKVFYEPDMSFYEDCSLKPERSNDFSEIDCLKDIGRVLRDEGLRVLPLIPICAAERIAQQRPDLAVKNIYGSADRLFLCYNNPEVRSYRMAMIKDIVTRHEIDGLMLDKIPQTILEQNALTGIFDAPLRTVGSFCFCPHCKARAKKSGLDIERIQARAKEIANRSLRMPPSIISAQGNKVKGDTEIPLLLLEEPLIYEMLQFRFETAVEFVGEICNLVRELKPDISLEGAFVPPAHFGHDTTSPRSWLAIQSYKKYAEVFDEITCVIHNNPEVVHFETQRAVEATEGKTKIKAGMRLYGSTRPEEVSQLSEAALAAGSNGVHFLGYDVCSDDLLLALRKWVDSKKGSTI